MESIIPWVQSAITRLLPNLDLTPLPSKTRGKLWLSPEAFLSAMQAPALASWALTWARRAQRPRLPRGPGGRPRTYPDETVLLMAIIQTAWRMSYADIIDYVASHESLAALLGCTSRRSDGTLQTISQGQYWERRAAVGILPFLVFFLALVGQLIRLGVISGHELLVDSTRLRAWRHNDPGAAWSRCRGKATLYGYKVHTVLCRQAQLPVFVVVTAANVHDSLIGLLSVIASVMLFGLHVAVVYADAAYFDRRFLSWVQQHLHARPAVDYNPRRKGKRQLASLPFLHYWRRAVLGPRAAIERHFAQLKRYFGLKFFQCATYTRVCQFVLLTYIIVMAVALVAHRYQRPDLMHSRAGVLATAVP